MAGVEVVLGVVLMTGAPLQAVRSKATSTKPFRVRTLALSVVEVTRRFVMVPQWTGTQ
jgi:hypothetical protein